MRMIAAAGLPHTLRLDNVRGHGFIKANASFLLSLLRANARVSRVLPWLRTIDAYGSSRPG
jgi:hypothetical protein